MISRLIDSAFMALPPKVIANLTRHTPRPLIDYRLIHGFRETVRYCAARSPFYKKKFKEFGINPGKVKSPKDLGDFYTTPDDIINDPESFLCQKPQIVFESSGTSGKNKQLYFTHKELEYIGNFIAIGYNLGGLTKEDRFANAFDFSMWIPGMVNHYGLQRFGAFCMAFGKVDPIEVYNRIQRHRLNVIMGEPTWLIKLTEIAEQKGAFPLKAIIGSAEEMPAAAKPWIEKVWAPAKVYMAYASVESGGAIGYQFNPKCKDYHVDDANFLVETVDCDESGYGEICFTTLARTTMPLIRYRNRDVSKLTFEKCDCGIPSYHLSRIKGRRDEMVVASGGNLYPLMFENILKDIPGITNDWQIIFRLKGIKEILEFNLESAENKAGNLKDQIFENIKNLYPDLWKNYSIGIFEMDFEFKKPGSIRTQRKLKRLIDERFINEV